MIRRNGIDDRAAIPATYVIYAVGSQAVAEPDINSGKARYSGDPATVINQALSALTASRTWKEKVVVKGNFSIGTTIRVPSYTILECHGKLSLSADTDLIKSESDTVDSSYIEISRGVLDGNGHTGEGIKGMFTRSTIHDCYISGFDVGVHINGVSWAESGKGCVVMNNQISLNGTGVWFDAYASDNVCAFNIINSWIDAGVLIDSPANFITENHIWAATGQTGNAAVRIVSTDTTGLNNRITNNSISSKYNGIVLDTTDGGLNHIIIVGNTLRDCSSQTNNTYDHILIKRDSGASTCDHVMIHDNLFAATEFANKPKYCIDETIATTNCSVVGNSLDGYQTASVLQTSAAGALLVKSNVGVVDS